MTYDTTNEIGRIYNGETVEVLNSCDNTYWYVYSSKLCRYGYVNRNYLTLANTCVKVNPSPCVNSFTVYGTRNYLAIRSDKTYDENNEIGRLYNGETVQLISTSDNSYWYVYAPSLNRYGYVNSNYLR